MISSLHLLVPIYIINEKGQIVIYTLNLLNVLDTLSHYEAFRFLPGKSSTTAIC